MKRGAEKQLTRDENGEEEQDTGDGEPKIGLKRADAAELNTRKIRGLPRRATPGGTGSPSTLSGSATPNSEAPAAPKFSGFAGFGSSTLSPTPFSFTAPQNPPAPSSATTNSLSLPLSAFSSTTSAFTLPAPAASTTSNATKLFTSIVNSSSPTEPKLQNDGSSQPTGDDRVKAETTYYTALRGLNVAFLIACKKAVEADPYTDIAGVLERYNQLRSGIKSDYDESVNKGSSSIQAPSPKAEPKPHAPPSSFAGFGGSSSALVSAVERTSETKSSFSMPVPPSGFSGFSSFSASSTTLLGEGGFKPQRASSPPSRKSSSFGVKPSDNSSKPTESAASNGVKSAFTFGPSTSGGSFAFGDSGKKTEGSDFGSTPSVFSSSLFGPPSTSTESEQTDKPEDSTPPTMAVGKLTSSSSLPFAFGSSSPKQPFGFGKPSGSGSLGNPVGFGFGSPPKASDAAPLPTSGFAFGAPKVVETTSGDGEGSEAAVQDDAPPLLVTNSVHDQDGEGEEDEVTKFEQKCKVYKMAKKDDGSQEWKDMGIGLLKVKAHKETDARRLLLRNSSTGKIQINFNVHAGMNPSTSKSIVSLMGHENGAPLPYKLRVKTADQADELQRILQEEVENVKAKS
ncbi:hypothetical protein BDY19DRAFT_902911 [Irpex rosettiformis]|uniref:Uncharacterized protein n=1 Tax=Irpex rosettiformis TaxID=378272 RepID=A0ACB8UFR6_9APHY|nr:hypothetical protein BDY19DRAFT_902911 [Irpex rosettiformis]